MRKVRLVVSALTTLAFAGPARAQRGPIPVPPVDTAAVVSLRLTDGSLLTGRVVALDDTSLVIVTIAGLRVVTPRRAITEWRLQRGRERAGRFVEEDPNTSRLFFAPTGRTLPARRSYFADYFLFFPVVATGVTDRLTVAAGMSILPGATSQIVYFAPKVGVVRSPNVNVAVGGLYITVPGESGYAGSVYTAATFGSADHALTVVAGYPYANGNRTREPGVLFGGETRIGSAAKLMVEAWKLPGVNEIPTIVGMRFFGGHVTADFGLLRVIGTRTEGWPFVPWLDFAVAF